MESGSLKKLPEQIIGKKVLLRKLKLSDAPSIYRYVKHRDITRWTLHIPYPYPKNGAIKFIRHSWALQRADKIINYAITVKGFDEVVGVIGFQDFDWPNQSAELGYWLGKPFWGKGLMTEAIGLMLELAFRKLKLHRVRAGVFADNPASVKVLMKNGFKREGVLRHRRLRYGKWRDTVLHAILAPEWKKR